MDILRRLLGPKGLESSDRLLSLAGYRVRIVGFMAAAGLPIPGRPIPAPAPVDLGDEDEHLADDRSSQAAFEHLAGEASQRIVSHRGGAIELSRTLEAGALDAPDRHVCVVRLRLDDAASRVRLTQGEALQPQSWIDDPAPHPALTCPVC